MFRVRSLFTHSPRILESVHTHYGQTLLAAFSEGDSVKVLIYVVNVCSWGEGGGEGCKPYSTKESTRLSYR